MPLPPGFTMDPSLSLRYKPDTSMMTQASSASLPLDFQSARLPKLSSGTLNWSHYRQIITDLYIDQNLKLEDVRRYMKEKHGFKATARMYKTRFSQWSLRKNVNEDLKDSAGNVSSTNASKVSKTMSRPCRERLLKYRARKSSILSPIYANFGDRHVETALQQIKIYCEDVISATRSALPYLRNDTSSKVITACRAPNLNTSMLLANSDSTSVWELCNTALVFLQKGNHRSVVQALNQGCDGVADLIRSKPHDFFRKIFMVLGARAWSGFVRERQCILKFISDMASRVLGPHHPLSIAISRLRGENYLEECAEPALRYLVKDLPKRLGRDHEEVVLSHDSLAVALIRKREYSQAEKVLMTTIAETEASLGFYHEYTRIHYRRLANMYMHQKRWMDAERVCEDILHRDILAAHAAMGYNTMLPRFPGQLPVLQENSIRTMQDLAYLAAQRGDKECDRERKWEAAQAVCYLFSLDEMQDLLDRKGCNMQINRNDPLGCAYLVLDQCSSVWCCQEES